MTYTSLNYLLYAAVCLLVYGVTPKKYRWWVLLAASMGFYAIVCLKYIGFIILTAATTYFGGIKLGTGGLVRAYTSSAKLGLEQAEVCSVREVTSLKVKAQKEN